jgi:hypothetical protein
MERYLVSLSGKIQTDSIKTTETPLEAFLLGDSVLIPKKNLTSIQEDSSTNQDSTTDHKLWGVWTKESEIPILVKAKSRGKAIAKIKETTDEIITSCRLISDRIVKL